MNIQTTSGNVQVGFQYSKDNKGRTVTTARAIIGGIEHNGSVTCSKQDRFDKETGRKSALVKALHNVPRPLRAQIWAGYFNR